MTEKKSVIIAVLLLICILVISVSQGISYNDHKPEKSEKSGYTITFEKGNNLIKADKPKKSILSGKHYDFYAQGAHNIFLKDNVIEFDYGGEYVIISPQLIRFTNQTQAGPPIMISKPAILAGDNTITYNKAFGKGIDLILENNAHQLKEKLVIGDISDLPDADTLTGNVYFTFTGLMEYPDDLAIFINGGEYSSGTVKTGDTIEFRKNGTAVFYFDSPAVFDGQGESVAAEYILHKQIPEAGHGTLQDGKVFWTISVPFGWIKENSGDFPLTIDPTISYDFSFSGTDAWDYGGSVVPAPGSGDWIPASSADKAAISDQDFSYWETRKTAGHDQYDLQLYRFRLNNSVPVMEIFANWTGYGEADKNTSLHIWNYTSASYDLIDSAQLAAEGILTGRITNNGSYVDYNNDIYLLASAQHDNYAPPSPSGLNAAPGLSYVTISWNPAVDPDGDAVEYYVQIDGVGNSGWITGTSWYRDGLQQKKTYTYRVKSRDTFDFTESGWSTGTFKTPAGYGSCPFVYVWNGSGYEYQTDIAGSVINIPKKTVRFYNYSYIDLNDLKPENNTYKIKLREVIDEIDFVDQASLLLVDHPRNVEIVSSGSEKRPWEEIPFTIYTLKKPVPPRSAVYKDGTDITSHVRDVDGSIAPSDFYNDDYITLDFGRVPNPSNAKLVIDGWTFFNEKMRQGMVIDENVWPYIEVADTDGNWVKVREFGYITGDYKTMVIDLSDIFLSDDHRIRIHTGLFKGHSEIIMDRIRLDTSDPVPVSIHEVPAVHADLHYKGGASLVYSSLDNRIHAMDDGLMDEPMPYYGNYTKYGNVLPLLGSADDMYVIIRHGDELTLEFPAGDKVPPGQERTPIFKTFLWFKALSPTYPDPLPFRNMTQYPYDTSVEDYPMDEIHTDYIQYWNTREYLPPQNTNETVSPDNVPLNTAATRRSLHTNYVDIRITTGGGNTYWQEQGSSSSSIARGSAVKLSARARDDYCLESALLATNETGVWKNITGLYGSPLETGCADTWTWTNFTWSNSSILPGTTVGWRIYYSNNIGYSNYTGIMTFSVTDAVAPLWRMQGSSSNDIVRGGSVTLFAQGTDDYCLLGAALFTNESGTWGNRTFIDLNCSGNNWTWTNFTWTNSSVPAGKEVGWKICYSDNTNTGNCTDVGSFTIKNVYTWTSPSEYMVNPATWSGIASPAGYRTVNITSAPLNESGYLIPGLSPLRADIFDPAGSFVASVDLVGDGVYNGTFILDDQAPGGQYSINISGRSDLNGQFYVMRWSCGSCHADFERLPYTFDAAALHLGHADTRHSTGCSSCHDLDHAAKPLDCDLCHRLGEQAHVSDQSCVNDCHSPGGISCSDCHNDLEADGSGNTTMLSPAFGADTHFESVSCNDCHGNLPAPAPKPYCPDCHPLPGSGDAVSIPGSINMLTHSPSQEVPCGSCHNVEHSINPIGYTIDECRQCHKDVDHNQGGECSLCHGQDPHNVTFGGGPDCIQCHRPGSSMADHSIDTDVFNLSSHAGMNTGAAINDGYGETNGACWACHDSTGSNISGMGDRFNDPYVCADCHMENGDLSGAYGAPIVFNHYRNGSEVRALDNMSTDQESCIACHEGITMMVNPNNDSDTGSFEGDGLRETGGNLSYYHYGRKDPAMGTGRYGYCAFCHNSSTGEFDEVFRVEDNTAIINHSVSNVSGMPTCDNRFCHNSTASRLHDRNFTVTELTTTHSGGPDSRICLVCHNTYYLEEAPRPGKQEKHSGLNCSECHLYLPRDIHGIKYLQKDGTYGTSRSNGANCPDCHVIRTAVQQNLSVLIPEVQHPRSI